MSYKDRKSGAIFPTRQGTPTGSGNERQMLDNLGGAGSFRKQYRTNSDGSVTRCDTKNGMPQFITSAPPNAALSLSPAYMETGQLEWTFPGPENPARLAPAAWHFLNIPTDASYLGYIGAAGAQLNEAALSEGQESLAIGYPRSTDPAIDADAKESYGGATALKKTVAGIFPPSLFSGKLRLFMQAKYGAKETLTSFPFTIDILGESILLYYTSGEGEQLQFGFWAHNSPGIFTAPDGTFWLLVIQQSEANFTVTAYPITHSAEVQTLVTQYKAGSYADATEKSKMEAYIFAYSTINLTAPRIVGSFAAVGGAMAYGWKWKTDGSEASIVLHETLGSGAADLRWKSRTVHLAFSYADSVISMTSATTVNGEWTDGWNAHNIFVPERETTAAPLELFSLATNLTGVKPAFNYSGIPVYGYYVGDVWTAVTMSRTVLAAAFYEQLDSNILYDPTVDMSASSRYQYGQVASEQDCAYESHDVSAGGTMSVTVGAATYSGQAYYGNHSYYERRVVPAADQENFAGFVGYSTTPMVITSITTPRAGYPTTGSHDRSLGARSWMTIGDVTLEIWSHTGWSYHAWALVIPVGDCEAAYVATRRYDAPGIWAHTKSVQTGVLGFHGWTVTTATPGQDYSFNTWTQANAIGDFFGRLGALTNTSDTDPLPPETAVIDAFNKVVSGARGTPGGSLDTLFVVDRNYPYYNRGIYTYTSYNGRYVMSEGLVSPASVHYQYRFVGWA